MINKDQQRADFEAFAKAHYAEFGQSPNLTRSDGQPHGYADPNVNALWWGFRAGQDALMMRLEDRSNE